MEKSNCKKDWVIKDGDLGSCPIHKQHFWVSKGQKCKHYKADPLIADEENSKKKDLCEKPISKNITKTVADKHKSVADLYGMVADLHEKGCGIVAIAKKLGVSHQYISKIVRSLNSRGSSRERFHNYSLTFSAIVPFDSIDLPEIKLRGWSYKKYKDDEFFVQVMRGKVLIRYLRDIVGDRIVKSEYDAIERIKNFIKSWNVYNITFLDYIVSSGHNEFMNNPIAKSVASKGQRIRYKDRVDGKMRTTIDFSMTEDNPSGAPMFEHEHNKHFVPDSEKWEGIIDDVANDRYLPLNVVKNKISIHDEDFNKVLEIIKELALNQARQNAEQTKMINDVTINQNVFAENQISHVKSVQELGQGVQSMTTSIQKLDNRIEELGRISSNKESSDMSIKEYKAHKSRKILKEYGW